MTAMLDAHRVGMPEVRRGNVTRYPAGFLLNAFRTECEHAAMMRQRGTRSDARIVVETGRRRVFTVLTKRFRGLTVARHTKRIEMILDRVEETTRAPQDDMFAGREA
jgi:hypothetical protein